MNSRGFALFALFMVQLLYGLNYTFSKTIINEGFISPSGLVMMRLLGAAILFWLFDVVFPKEKIERKDFITFFIAAIFGVVINMMFFLKGLELTTPIHASSIMTITPIIILILSVFFLKEKVTLIKVIGIVIAFSGAIYLTLNGDSPRKADNVLLGNTYILLNATSYSIYIIIIKKLTQKYHPFTFIKWLFLFGLLMLMPFGYSDIAEIDWGIYNNYAWGALIFVVLGATFGTYFLNPLALKTLKASTVGAFIYLQPAIAGAFAVFMGVEHIDLIKIFAILLIFIGVYLVILAPVKKKKIE